MAASKEKAVMAARKAAIRKAPRGGSPDEQRRIMGAINAGIEAMAAQWPELTLSKKKEGS